MLNVDAVYDSFYFAGSTECGSERITLTREQPWQRDDQEVNQGETNRDLRPPIRVLHIGRCEGTLRVAPQGVQNSVDS